MGSGKETEAGKCEVAWPWPCGQEAAEWGLHSSFLTLKSQYASTSHCFKNYPEVSPLAMVFLSLPSCPLLSHTGLCWDVSPGDRRAGDIELSAHTAPGGPPPLPLVGVRYPLTWTLVEGNATFWRPSTLSDNSAVQFERLRREVADFLKLNWCLFNFAITSMYYLCFTHRETALHCAIELVVQWLKGIKQWLWYFKYWLGGIFNSFLIMKATKKPSYTTLEHLFSFLFWVDPTETEKKSPSI